MNSRSLVLLTSLALFSVNADAVVRCSGTAPAIVTAESGIEFTLPVKVIATASSYEVQRTASWSPLPNDFALLRDHVTSSVVRVEPATDPQITERLFTTGAQGSTVYYVVTARASDPAGRHAPRISSSR